MHIRKLGLFLTFLMAFLTACKSEFTTIKESTDVKLKYTKSLEYFKAKEFENAIELMEDVRPFYIGRVQAQVLFYHLAQAFYAVENYDLSAFYYEELVADFPNSQYYQEALFNIGKCYLKLSPKHKRDQKYTRDAINAFQTYINQFPKSEKRQELNNLVASLLEKIQYKWFEIANLYKRIKDYKSAVIVYENFLNDYVDSPYTEQAMFNKLDVSYRLAISSVESKKKKRVYDALENYNTFFENFGETSPYFDKANELKNELLEERKLFNPEL